MDSNLLQQAKDLIKAGHPAEARRILSSLIAADPKDVSAWFWMVETMSDIDQKAAVLEQCLRFNPENREAQLGLQRFTTQSSLVAPFAVPPISQAEIPPGQKITPEVQPSVGPPSQNPVEETPTFLESAAQTAVEAPDEPETPQQPVVARTPAAFRDRPVEDVQLDDLQNLRKRARRPSRFWNFLLPLVGLLFLLGLLYAIFAFDVPNRVMSSPAVAQLLSTATHTPSPTNTPTSGPTATPTPTPTPFPSVTPLPSYTPIILPGIFAGQIAFSSNRNGRNADLYVVQADGSGLTNLTVDSPAQDTNPDWSPDGLRLAYESQADIFILTLAGGIPTNLTNAPGDDIQPDWSPDGSEIVFVSNRDGGSELYVTKADGSEVTLLTTMPGPKFWPAWSPDGTRVLFAGLQGEDFDLYVVNRDGSGLKRLHDTPANEINPAWSPDGRQIVYVSDQSGNNDIYLMASDGARTIQLTDDRADDETPAWSPQGDWIIFSSKRVNREYATLFVMRPNGKDQTLFLETEAWDLQPDWIR